jgi:hypothetical protein
MRVVFHSVDGVPDPESVGPAVAGTNGFLSTLPLAGGTTRPAGTKRPEMVAAGRTKWLVMVLTISPVLG